MAKHRRGDYLHGSRSRGTYGGVSAQVEHALRRARTYGMGARKTGHHHFAPSMHTKRYRKLAP